MTNTLDNLTEIEAYAKLARDGGREDRMRLGNLMTPERILRIVGRLQTAEDNAERWEQEIVAHEAHILNARARWRQDSLMSMLDIVRQQIAGLWPDAAGVIAEAQSRCLDAEERATLSETKIVELDKELAEAKEDINDLADAIATAGYGIPGDTPSQIAYNIVAKLKRQESVLQFYADESIYQATGTSRHTKAGEDSGAKARHTLTKETGHE